MSSGFISEAEAVEARRVRQEQWEKVRTSTQPLEAPEEPYDGRPLYQRLEEQKNKKDAEYEEAHKLKNMIRGLDDDEVGFLELVEESKASVARQISLEEQREMKDFRERVSSVQDTMERERLQQISGAVRQVPTKRTSTNTTRNLLQGVIVKKRKISDSESKNKNDDAESSSSSKVNGVQSTSSSDNHSQQNSEVVQKNNSSAVNVASIPSDKVSPHTVGALKCIGILPGIGPYKDSSDSDCSSDSDDEGHDHPEYDLLGRKLKSKDESDNH